jgi:hypothetical protein
MTGNSVPWAPICWGLARPCPKWARNTAVRRNKGAYETNADRRDRDRARSRMDPVACGASRHDSQLALLPAAWGLAVVPAECRREGVDG